jgi:DNA-binding transcriptional LysR family regulator
VLHIAQPMLSRPPGVLEDERKVRLFVRDNKRADARPLLASADAVHRRLARAAAGTTPSPSFMPGLLVTAPVWALFGLHPDVGYVRLPMDQRVQVRPLLSEPRVAVVPMNNRLVGKERISTTDLADEHLLQDPWVVPEGRDIATELRSRRPAGYPDDADGRGETGTRCRGRWRDRARAVRRDLSTCAGMSSRAAFAVVVPFLIAGAPVRLLVGPRLRRVAERSEARGPGPAAAAAAFPLPCTAVTSGPRLGSCWYC